MARKQEWFMLRVYDKWAQDVVRDVTKRFETVEHAIRYATKWMEMDYQPSDCMEIQVCSRVIGGCGKSGMYQMIGCVEYVGDDNMLDNEVTFEECFC